MRIRGSRSVKNLADPEHWSGRREETKTNRPNGCSVSDPDPVGSAFNLGLDPDPYSESGFPIQVSKNRFKKLKFTMTDLNDENRTILTTVSSHFFKNILLLAILSYLALLKSLSHRVEFFLLIVLLYNIVSL
jgi:hypothetical protein